LAVGSVLASSTTTTSQPTWSITPRTTAATVADSLRAGNTARHAEGAGERSGTAGFRKGSAILGVNQVPVNATQESARTGQRLAQVAGRRLGPDCGLSLSARSGAHRRREPVWAPGAPSPTRGPPATRRDRTWPAGPCAASEDRHPGERCPVLASRCVTGCECPIRARVEPPRQFGETAPRSAAKLLRQWGEFSRLRPVGQRRRRSRSGEGQMPRPIHTGRYS